MQTRIKSIENPQSPLMRLAYWIRKKKYGKVLTPLKALYSRLPISFSLWANRIHPLEQKLEIPQELTLLVRVYVSQLNSCSFCIDIGTALSIEKFNNGEKFRHLADYPQSDRYSPAEKAALDFAHALTVHKKVSEEVYRRADRYFSENQLIALAWVVSTEHLYNLMNAAFNIPSDGFCAMPGQPAVLAEA